MTEQLSHIAVDYFFPLIDQLQVQIIVMTGSFVLSVLEMLPVSHRGWHKFSCRPAADALLTSLSAPMHCVELHQSLFCLLFSLPSLYAICNCLSR